MGKTIDELACTGLVVKRSIAIEQLNIADSKKLEGERCLKKKSSGTRSRRAH